jgi:choline dehydrogenase-like flavoprotein
MSPVEVALLSACAVLLVAALAVTLVATVRLLRMSVHVAGVEESLRWLTERVEELTRREAAREAAEEATAQQADWVITYDGDEPPDQHAGAGDRRTVATTHVVGTALGEPLIKVAAFSHGVRHALREEKRARLAYQVRREYRRRRRESRARARAAQRGHTQSAATRANNHADSTTAKERTAQ